MKHMDLFISPFFVSIYVTLFLLPGTLLARFYSLTLPVFFFMFVKVCNDTLSLSHRLLGDKRFLR